MISKAEFLEYVKTEILPNLWEKWHKHASDKLIGKINYIGRIMVRVCFAVILLIILSTAFDPKFLKEELDIIFQLSFFGLIASIFLSRFHIGKRTNKVKKELLEAMGFSQKYTYKVELNPSSVRFFKISGRKFYQASLPPEAIHEEVVSPEYENDAISDFLKDSNEKWILNGQKIKLFKNDDHVKRSTFVDDTNLFFEDANAFVFEGRFGFSRGRSYCKVLQGLFIEINLKRSYGGPIVFAKKGLFNGRKGLKKVQLPYQDAYFNVLANDETSAKNLCFQGVPEKLLRLKGQLGITKVEASFFENKLYIALSTPKDLFACVAKHPKDLHQYEAFYDNIKQIEDYCAQFRDL